MFNSPTGFFSEVFPVTYFNAVSSETEVVIEPESSQNQLRVHTDNIQYSVSADPGSQSMQIKEKYLPVEHSLLEGSICSTTLRDFINIAPDGPLCIKIKNDNVKFITNSDTDTARLDITDKVTVHTDKEKIEYAYDIRFLWEMVKKFPKKEQIQFLVTDELVKLRYVIGDNIGTINYYQLPKKGYRR